MCMDSVCSLSIACTLTQTHTTHTPTSTSTIFMHLYMYRNLNQNRSILFMYHEQIEIQINISVTNGLNDWNSWTCQKSDNSNRLQCSNWQTEDQENLIHAAPWMVLGWSVSVSLIARYSDGNTLAQNLKCNRILEVDSINLELLTTHCKRRWTLLHLITTQKTQHTHTHTDVFIFHN